MYTTKNTGVKNVNKCRCLHLTLFSQQDSQFRYVTPLPFFIASSTETNINDLTKLATQCLNPLCSTQLQIFCNVRQ